MRLLVTRPEPDAARTADRLRALGHSVWIEPLLRAVAAPPPPFDEAPAALAVTSRNALRAIAGWPQLAAWRSCPLYAVGDATAAMAAAMGFADIRSAGGTAADLAALIAAREAPHAGTVLYIAAEQRRADLAGALRGAGISVTLIEAYRMATAEAFSAAVARQLAEGGLDGVLFYSERTASAFATLIAGAAAKLGGVTAFALSPEVAKPLASLGFGSLATASHPTEAALFALVPAA